MAGDNLSGVKATMAESSGTWEEEVVRWKRVGELGMERALREIGCPEERVKTALGMPSNIYFDLQLNRSRGVLKCFTELELATIYATAGRGNSCITSMWLGDETETEATAFCVNLSSNTNIKSLFFGGKQPFFSSSKGCTLLGNALATNPAIQRLNFSYVGVGSEGVSSPMNGLQRSKSLVSLDLSENPLGGTKE